MRRARASTRGELHRHPADRSIDGYVPTLTRRRSISPIPGVAPLLGFGAGVAVGALSNNNSWNWGTGAIFPPTWAGFRAGAATSITATSMSATTSTSAKDNTQALAARRRAIGPGWAASRGSAPIAPAALAAPAEQGESEVEAAPAASAE